MKKKLQLLFSMKVAISILLLLIVACVIGSVIPQQAEEVIYTSNYSSFIADCIIHLGLDDVFHSWWFIVLTVFLCINLLGCNIFRFPTILKQYKNYKMENMPKINPKKYQGKPEDLLKSLGFHHVQKNEKGYYANKNKIGVWGAWLTHLGMLIIIVGFSLGQMFTEKYVVYGIPGETKQIENIPYELTIKDFRVELRDDETVEQYVSDIIVTNLENDHQEEASISVNHPATIDHMKFYQNSTGWASTIEIQKDGQAIQSALCYAGEYIEVEDVPGLIVLFRSFYPDYVDYEGYPSTASSKLNNPGYLYMIYYQDELIGMNVLTDDKPITIDQYSIYFKDPKSYTLIQVKHDPYTWLVGIGAGILMVALYLSFYMQTQEIYIEDDIVYSRSRKGGILFEDRIKEKIESLEGRG